MTQPTTAPPQPPQEPPPTPPRLRRAPRHKVVAGVCAGLGRHCDIDPVIFRIVIGVLSVTGGIGLIFYGFAWLLIPADDEEENEFRRMLSGRVDGASLSAVLLALLGCGLLLTMLGDGNMLGFVTMLSIAVTGAAVWSQRRTHAPPGGAHVDTAAAQAAAEAPPETKAPPVPDRPSWWRDPIVKDGTTGPVPTGYLWGPESALDESAVAPPRPDGRPSEAVVVPQPRGPRGIGGAVFLLALVAGGLGTGLSWDSRPLGTALQIGLVAALAVFGLGLVVSTVLGRTGFGTVLLTMVTAASLAGAAALPADISTKFGDRTWTPTSAAAVQQRYEMGSGQGTLDLSAVDVPAGQTLSTRAQMGLGHLTVVVPKDAVVRLEAEVGVGDIRLPGDAPDDVDVGPGQDRRRTLPAPPGATPGGTLVLDLELGIGQVEVTRAAS